MKKTVLLLAAFFICAVGHAQFFTIGPRIGVSQSYLRVNETYNEVKYKTGDPVVGFHAGLFARVTISSFYVQPELLFTNAGGKIRLTDNASANVNEMLEYKYNRVDVPVLVGLKLSFVRFNAGPVASFNVNTENKSPKELGKELENRYKSATIGFQAGVGLDLWKVIVDLKYESGLDSQLDKVNINGTSYSFDQRAQQVLLSIGYKL